MLLLLCELVMKPPLEDLERTYEIEQDQDCHNIDYKDGRAAIHAVVNGELALTKFEVKDPNNSFQLSLQYQSTEEGYLVKSYDTDI